MADSPGRINTNRLITLGILLIVSIALEYYLHIQLGMTKVYPHAFYIPIILAAFWWGAKSGFFTALFLGILNTFSYYPEITNDCLGRAFAFVLIGFTTGFISDKRSQAESKLSEAKQELDAVFQCAGVGIRVINTDYKIINQNKEMGLLCGFKKDDAVGGNCSNFFSGDNCTTDKCALRQILSGVERVEVETKRTTKDGRIIHVNLMATPLRNNEGEIVGVIESFRDITERKKIEKEREKLTEELRRQVRIDGLTKVLSRRYLDKKLQDEVRRTQRYNCPLSVIMLDIDNFKEINDTYGHQMGDKALRVIAKSIREVMRANDFVGRYGGEEFIVVCVEAGIDEARNIAERVRKAIEKLQVAGKMGPQIKMTASFGVAQFKESEDFDTFVTRVDTALYKAKNEGRNQVCIAKGN
ncbi:MAG TPA: diguanylate cyclase [Actinobacteria bacterium]|nr:diguanylate cyclase [Actinomycetota bacterium]